jgi:hypothetical protein
MASTSAKQIPTNVNTSSEPIINSPEVQAQNSTRQFNLRVLRDAFIDCIQPDNTLLLREYVRAYEELCV